MPWMNYCKKCKLETPPGEFCDRCGGKLTKAGERLSLYTPRVPVKDWFCWNAALRVVLPVFLLVVAFFVLLEALTRGVPGVRMLLGGSFPAMMLWLLAGLLLLILGYLLLRGPEVVKTVLDKDGARQWVYAPQQGGPRLLARLNGKEALSRLRDTADPLNGYSPVREQALRWADLRRMGEWRETNTLLLYHPRLWLTLAVRLSEQEYDEAREYIRRKAHLSSGASRKRSVRKKR